MLSRQEIERFTSKYEKQRGGCWVWQAKLDPDGYGVFWLRRKNRRAHRVAWFLVHGDLPDESVVNHACRNRACVNPQHLQVMSASQHALHDTASICYINKQKIMCPEGHPYDRKYGNQRYCSICDAAKKKRLRAKWAAEPDPLQI